MSEQSNLPSLQDLHHDVGLAFKNDQLNLLLNQQPHKQWLKQHPFANKEAIDEKGQKRKVPIDYLPVDKVEFLLTRIFQHWRVEVVNYSQLFNSVSCHVRLHYKNPVTGEWSYHDGLGAVGIQTDAGATASDMSRIKQDAVMKALPAAKSYALKDAADHLGSLFGRDLNRSNPVTFSGSYTPAIDKEELVQLYELKKDALTPEERANVEKAINSGNQANMRSVHDFLKSK